MPTVTKHLISIGLLFALLTPPLLVGSWFQLTRHELRREARQLLLAGVEPGELEVFEFTVAEAQAVLKWERSDEFEYRGRMYDVVRVEQTGPKVRYWCWPDEGETRLNRELRALTAQLMRDAPQPKEQAGHLLTYFKSLFFRDRIAWQAYIFSEAKSGPETCVSSYTAPALPLWPSPPRLG